MKKSKRPDSCNVLDATLLGKQLWQFAANDGKPKLETHLAIPPEKPAPSNLVSKNWRTLWSARVNIAWLPADQVFLRVVQLPPADPSEIASMLEFQLEKLSPLPVAQIAWSFELVPSLEINNITAIVIIVARDTVEEQIGTIEQGGYQPDRLELPHLYQIVADAPQSDGVLVYPWIEGTKEFCLAAWWATGSIRNLQLIHLPSGGDRAALLKESLLKTAWAAEMEGWLQMPVRWKVVTTGAHAAEWQSVLQDLADGTVTVSEPMPAAKLAEYAASRAAKGDPAANLLPSEFATRYRQQLVDRLWMRGLLAAVAVYLLVVLGYFLAVQWVRIRVLGVERQVAGLAQSYTNTVRMKERVQILQDQKALKYAALDCWKAASDLLPTEVTLKSLVFSGGQRLELRGVADNARALGEYNEALRNATIGGQQLFSTVSLPTSSTQPGSGTVSWAFNCEVNRQEIE